MTKPLRTYQRIECSFVRESATQPYGPVIRNGGDLALLTLDCIGRSATREHFLVMPIDCRNRLIGIHVASIGTLNAAHVHPREIFSVPLTQGATSIIVAHNHPSGDPTPSAEDRKVTERLRDAGILLGVPVLDHIVVGSERYYSFAEEAIFPLVRS